MKDAARRPNDQRDEEEQKRESGEPGGGKGRRDEVGRSGVYPMSGPHPAGHAEIKGQAGWGQGERGAAGYEDHGGSELSFEGGQLLGGLNIGPGGEPLPEPGQSAQELAIPREQWTSFLNSFSRQHQDWLAIVEIAGPKGRLVAVEERRLKGISIDRTEGHERVHVYIGDTPEEHVTHTVPDPTQVTFLQSQRGEHIGLVIASADGKTRVIRFRTPIRPEMLDGIAA